MSIFVLKNSSGQDEITQEELNRFRSLQNQGIRIDQRCTKLIETFMNRLTNGARIEPGPSTIVIHEKIEGGKRTIWIEVL